ncbi:S-adenosyl-L-methionine-dependent methyltransferase [Suillus clintonianus]|uniref:S-adenosyl-L-methionine-dependent methyltransferase n=1 Tax=Suillus clintonianus TaxID=1904413 RepID=UPI001B887206|nr:S-adenosyl-L-methionine-dependent methyltransferase [Suillus clintonianus]KAG2141036.1 S-adenosyl-L-methionine-dependent methyltransferase [Suillus clintonianus]
MANFRAPTSFLPPLSVLSTHTTASVQDALQDLKDLYFPAAPLSPKRTWSINAVPALKQDISDTVHVPRPKRTGRLKHIDGVPDSGYASEEDEAELDGDLESEVEGLDVDVLRSDELERNFAIKWLTGLIKRSDMWMHALDSAAEQEEHIRLSVIEEASNLLARFSGDDEQQEDDTLTRQFRFPFGTGGKVITIELNDAPLTPTDHTSVGLQSWASAIIFAERICADPTRYMSAPQGAAPLRILELGAGTGLLSIAAARLLDRMGVNATIVATDYHSAVLHNLLQNVQTNNVSVQIESLDWSRPPPLEPYDVILAADVVYHPEHAKWIKDCVEKALQKGGVFWLIIAMRSTGRHEGLWETVDDVFPDGGCGFLRIEGCGGEMKLAVVQKEDVGRREGIGRADEVGYMLFEIRWVPCR